VYIVHVRGRKQDAGDPLASLRVQHAACVVVACEYFKPAVDVHQLDLADVVAASNVTGLNSLLFKPLKFALKAAAGSSTARVPSSMRTTRAAPIAAPIAAPVAPPEITSAPDVGPRFAPGIAELMHRLVTTPTGPAASSADVMIAVASEIVSECPESRVGGRTYANVLLALHHNQHLSDPTVYASVRRCTVGVAAFLFERRKEWALEYFVPANANEGRADVVRTDKAPVAKRKFIAWLQSSCVLNVEGTIVHNGHEVRVRINLHDQFDFVDGNTPLLTSFEALYCLKDGGGCRGVIRLCSSAIGTSAEQIVELLMAKQFFVATTDRSSALMRRVGELQREEWTCVPSPANASGDLSANVVVPRADTFEHVVHVQRTDSTWQRMTFDATRTMSDECNIVRIFAPMLNADPTLSAALLKLATHASPAYELQILCKRVRVQGYGVVDPSFFVDFGALATALTTWGGARSWSAAIVAANGALHPFASSREGACTKSHIVQRLEVRDLKDMERGLQSARDRVRQADKVAVAAADAPVKVKVGPVEALMGYGLSQASDNEEYVERVWIVATHRATPTSMRTSSALNKNIKSPLLKSVMKEYIRGKFIHG
jgi:hypothetical protein